MNGIASRFAEALQTLERSGDSDPIVDLFAPEAEVGNATIATSRSGREGAREFWSTYLDTFERIRSEFRVIVEGDGAAALEWHATGRLSGGSDVDYEGVSVIEFEDDRINRFTAYFDSAAIAKA